MAPSTEMPWPLASAPNGTIPVRCDSADQRSPRRRWARFSVMGIAARANRAKPPKSNRDRRSPFATMCPAAQMAKPHNTGCRVMRATAPTSPEERMEIESGFRLRSPAITRKPPNGAKTNVTAACQGCRSQSGM
ncbi:conserved hypothetical protein [Ricinus communis]|uniref:Uncharacterized protein n=1 Tax=Ricinus communis TaxID=3988 RepID=B9TIT9_RICCO|nr:conserved hypothetical protein [Ricinus communis]